MLDGKGCQAKARVLGYCRWDLHMPIVLSFSITSTSRRIGVYAKDKLMGSCLYFADFFQANSIYLQDWPGVHSIDFLQHDDK